ncbi:hypothetical protein C5167_019065 [Papaver somniferum]|uniref:Uncharacterized protein n=1 Tax=Papaver somniferum TaxID=3469 RepID=A0A4Y7IR88_PAPSO|nr:hypothetical protein C5167_019065 [Papaver somniferum]
MAPIRKYLNVGPFRGKKSNEVPLSIDEPRDPDNDSPDSSLRKAYARYEVLRGKKFEFDHCYFILEGTMYNYAIYG